MEKPEEIQKYQGGFKRIRLFIPPQYMRLFSDLETRLLQRIRSSDLDASTTGRFFRQWTRNFLALIQSKKSITFLKGLRFSVKPDAVLFCGAGPNLIDDLQKNEQAFASENRNLFIVAADSAVAPLLARNIRPDLIISVDSGPGTAYHFRAVDRLIKNRHKWSLPLDIPVLSWSAGPRLLELYFKEVYYYRSSFPFDQLLGAGPLKDIQEWRNLSRNTAGIALLAGALVGMKCFYTAGADFCSINDQSHIRGTGYTIYSIESQNRIHPVEMYRPGGYGKKPIAKNRVALNGLLKMAEDLEIEIKPLKSNRLPERSASLGWKFSPVYCEFNSAALCNYLKDIWSEINFHEFASDIEIKTIDKWKKILK